MKNHVLECCAQCASHHLGLAKAHRRMAESTEGDSQAFHKACSDLHASQGEFFVGLAKSLSADSNVSTHDDSSGTDSIKVKAGRTDDLHKFGMLALKDSDELQPSAVSVVVPDRSMNKGRLVSRPGEAIPDETEDHTATIDGLQKSPDEIRKAMLQG